MNRIVRFTVTVITMIMVATAPAPANAESEQYHNSNVSIGFYQDYASGGSMFYYDMFAPTEENPYEWAPCDERCGYIGLKEGAYYVAGEGEVINDGYISYHNEKKNAYFNIEWDGSFAPYKEKLTWKGKRIRVTLTSASLSLYNPAVPEVNYPSCEMKC